MGFTIFMSLTVIATVSFFVTDKRLHVYEYVFSYLLFVMVLVTGVDVLSPRNSEYLHTTKEMSSYWTLRLVEVVLVPLIVLFYLEIMNRLTTWLPKVVVTFPCLCVLFGVESGLVLLQAFTYVEWKPWWSWLAWLGLLLFAYSAQRGFRKLLKREGAIT